MNVENLLKMADYVETIPQEAFSMHVYRTLESTTIECNSVGCIIGHCIILDPEPENIPRAPDNRIDFAKWSLKFTELDFDHHTWQWCFSADWYLIDNTPTGAAKRIRYLIEHGLPENWNDQMDNEALLCYN